jgi:hypothetical protein
VGIGNKSAHPFKWPLSFGGVLPRRDTTYTQSEASMEIPNQSCGMLYILIFVKS